MHFKACNGIKTQHCSQTNFVTVMWYVFEHVMSFKSVEPYLFNKSPDELQEHNINSVLNQKFLS